MSPRTARPPTLLTVAEAADQLRLNPRQVYELIYRGDLPSITYPSRGRGAGPRRIRQTAIDKFLNDCEKSTA